MRIVAADEPAAMILITAQNGASAMTDLVLPLISLRDIQVYGSYDIRDRKSAITYAETLERWGWLAPVSRTGATAACGCYLPQR
jgi:hypothetical protein